jgi:hypothetical protein
MNRRQQAVGRFLDRASCPEWRYPAPTPGVTTDDAVKHVVRPCAPPTSVGGVSFGSSPICGGRRNAARVGLRGVSLRGALGQSRLTGQVSFVRVPRRPAARLLLDLTKETRPVRRSTPGQPANNIRWGRCPRTCEVILASSGRRGRDDARGQPAHVQADLTRTSRRASNVPSRDGRRGRHLANCVITATTASSCAQSQDAR